MMLNSRLDQLENWVRPAVGSIFREFGGKKQAIAKSDVALDLID